MMPVVVTIDCSLIGDFDSMHTLFSKTFGFATYYGKNMDAWVDIMSSLDQGEGAKSRVRLADHELLLLILDQFSDFKRRCPDVFHAIADGAASVNQRRFDDRATPMIALAFLDSAASQ